MYCKNCGAQIPDNSAVCNYCGTAQTRNPNSNTGYQNFGNPQPNYNTYQPNFEPIKKGSIIAALVFGILTTNIVAIILSILALIYANDYDTAIRHGDFITAEKKKSMIKTFKIISWVFIALTIFFYIIFFAVFGTVFFSTILNGDFSEFDDFYFDDLIYTAVQMLKFRFLG